MRVNEQIFRSRVFEAYDYRCCITGMECLTVLQACHIKEWSACPENSSERLDPRNGLCMNALHHQAFDDGLFTIDEHCKVELSPHLEDVEIIMFSKDSIILMKGRRSSPRTDMNLRRSISIGIGKRCS